MGEITTQEGDMMVGLLDHLAGMGYGIERRSQESYVLCGNRFSEYQRRFSILSQTKMVRNSTIRLLNMTSAAVFDVWFIPATEGIKRR